MAKANSFEHISIGAVKVLARLAAKKAVQAELKDAGVRVTLVKPVEISERAAAYLLNHPELNDRARLIAERMIREGVFGKRAQRAYPIVVILHLTSAQPNPLNSAHSVFVHRTSID